MDYQYAINMPSKLKHLPQPHCKWVRLIWLHMEKYVIMKGKWIVKNRTCQNLLKTSMLNVHSIKCNWIGTDSWQIHKKKKNKGKKTQKETWHVCNTTCTWLKSSLFTGLKGQDYKIAKRMSVTSVWPCETHISSMTSSQHGQKMPAKVKATSQHFCFLPGGGGWRGWWWGVCCGNGTTDV